MEVDRKVLLQLAKREPFRLRDTRELRLLNGRGGQRSRGKRLFQSVPAKDAPCPQPPVKGLSQLRKRAGQSGGRRKRRARFAPQEVSSKPVNECKRDFSRMSDEREQRSASCQRCSNRQVFAENAARFCISIRRVTFNTDGSSRSVPLGAFFVIKCIAAPCTTENNASTKRV